MRIYLSLLFFLFHLTNYSQNESKGLELFNKIEASGNFALMRVIPKGKSYNLYLGEKPEMPTKVFIDRANGYSPTLFVFDIKTSKVCDYIFRVINSKGQVGWVLACEIYYSDLDLAFGIGKMNDEEYNPYFQKDFKEIYKIENPKLLLDNNNLVSERNKEKYSSSYEFEKKGDSIHKFVYQKLFFGYNCDTQINEIQIDKNGHSFKNKKVQTSHIVKSKNLFKIIIESNSKVYIERGNTKEEIDLNKLSEKLIQFIDNGSGTGDLECEYCRGRKDQTSSSNPTKATIGIQNKLNSKNYYKIYNLYKEIRKAYNMLWAGIAGRNGITEFDKIDCKIQNNYKNKYPVNIIYYHRDFNGFPPPTKEVIKTKND